MKKIIFLLIFLPYFVFGQDIEPTQLQFNLDTTALGAAKDSMYISTNMDYFTQNKFLLGWHWGGGWKMTQAMRMNQAHTESNTNISQLDSGLNLIVIINSIGRNRELPNVLQAQAVQYEPTLKLDDSQPDLFYTNYNDPANPVFGFQYIHPLLTNIDDDKRLILIKDSGYNDSLILKEPWINHALNFNDGITDDVSDSVKKLYDGRQLYFNINLRRHAVADSALDDSTVLKIKLPYINRSGQYGVIKFNQVPKYQPDSAHSIVSTSTLREYRGLAGEMQASEDTVFYITRNMLPLDKTDITLSAYFICDGTLPDNNRRLQLQNFAGDSFAIRYLNMEVEYLGHSSIEIDWMRIETPAAQWLLRGLRDSLIETDVQAAFDHYMTVAFKSKGIKPFRIYTRDEPNVAYWAAFRYFNKLVGNIGTTATGSKYPRHYDYYVEPPEQWLEIYGFREGVSAPYFFKSVIDDSIIVGNANWRTMNLRNGFGEMSYVFQASHDTLSSGYEINTAGGVSSFSNPSLDSIKRMSIPVLQQFLEYRWSWLCNFEDRVMELMTGHQHGTYLPDIGTGFYYSDRPWWAETFVGANWKFWKVQFKGEQDSVYKLFCDSHRPKTGEETRMTHWFPIILGAKGLVYDREYSNDKNCTGLGYGQDFYNNYKDTNNVLWNDVPNDEFLRSDSIGSDFFNGNEEYGLDQYLDYDTVAKYMRTTPDRIYIGRRSTRLELKKIHDWILNVEDTLMNLKLTAWHGNGIRDWYNQDTAYTTEDTVMENFVSLDTNDWKIRPIGREKSCGLPIASVPCPYYEESDSTFFDVTLHRNINKSMVDEYYVGVLNRRTDPLLYYTDTLNGGQGNKYMKFLSSAEFADSCRFSPDSLHWRSYWWKRLGCREITIPFDYFNPNDTNEYCLLRVTELGGDLFAQDSVKWWWRGPKYYDYVDTVIGQNRNVIAKFLPGEGKFFKVEVLHPPKNIAGYLHYSNQSKLIAYPILNAAGNETDSIRYHLTFFGQDTIKKEGEEDRIWNKVYYVRSNPIIKDSPNENIVWEDTLFISKNIYLDCNFLDTPIDTINCDHPSIVVRKDADSLKAYIVYTCNKLFTPAPIGYIVESILNVNSYDTADVRSSLNSKAIGDFQGREHDDTSASRVLYKEWGTPVINASANGNYYAWSDSALGIVAGFKAANENCLTDKEIIRWDEVFNQKAQHPSLNVYSHIDKNEDNCSLVWQENELIGGNLYSNIFYTRLQVRDSLEYYLPKETSNKKLLPEMNSDTTIACLSYKYKKTCSSYPVLIRNLSSYRFTPPEFFINNHYPNRREIVCWCGKPLNRVISEIYCTEIGLLDTSNKPISWSVTSNNGGFSFLSVGYLNLSQGPSRYDRNIYNKSGVVINFNKLDPITLNNFGIYQLYQPYHSFLTEDTKFNSISSGYRVSPIGKYSHLALYPHKLENNNMWRNRRVFEDFNFTPPKILSSAKYFYKSGDEDEIENDGFVGFVNDSNHFSMDAPLVDDEIVSLLLPYEKVEDGDSVGGDFYVPVHKDTIFSDSFNIGLMQMFDVDFVTYGTSSASITIALIGHPSATFIPLPYLKESSDTTGNLMKYRFLNAFDVNYRIAFINLDTNASYTEKLFIGGLPIGDTITDYGKRPYNSSDRIIIDLGDYGRQLPETDCIKLLVYPNPANNIVYATAYYPRKAFLDSDNKSRGRPLILKMYSMLGNELHRQVIKPGETIAIPIENYQQGIYLMTAQEKVEEYDVPSVPAGTMKFIIQR